MNLRNEMAGEQGNHASDSAPFPSSAGQVAVATLLVPVLLFMVHVSSHHRNNSAEYRNRGGMTYNTNVQVARCPRFISEEEGRDRTCGAGDNQRNTLHSIMLWPAYLCREVREIYWMSFVCRKAWKKS